VKKPTALHLFVLAALVCAWLAWLLSQSVRPDTWTVCASGLPLLVLASWLAARRRMEPWYPFVARTVDVHVLLFVLLFALGVLFEDAHGVTTDGVIYFTQLRSVLFDGDLDVAREFAYLEQPPRPAHVVPIGPIPVWLPFYLVVAGVDALGRAMGLWPAPADPIALGLTAPYVRAVLLASFIWGSAGLLVVHGMLRREFDRAPALSASLLLLGATSLFWYLVYEPGMTHAVSFGFVAFFVAAASRVDPLTASPRQLALVGTLLGLAFITRPQEAVFVLLPAFIVLALKVAPLERLKVAARYAAWGFAGFAPLLVLQVLHYYLYRHFSREAIVLVGGDQAFLTPLNSRWSETLFSSWHGFFSWTPVAYIAFIATLAYGKRRWPWAAATALIVFVMAWINGATPDIGGGWSFGGRRFVSCLVLLAPGLALVSEALIRRPMIAVSAIALLLIGWNALLVAQFRSGMLPGNPPITFERITRQQAEIYTRPPYFYPFAFPANAIFAWRTGLPVDAYDLLGPERLQPRIDLELHGSARRFLLDGWGAPTGDDAGSAWWTASSSATLLLPLQLPAGREVRIEAQARTRLAEPEVRVPVTVVVNGHVVGTFTPETTAPSFGTFMTSPGVWIRGFNRVTFQTPEPAWPVAIYRVRVTPIE
jgi:hypothetical protein